MGVSCKYSLLFCSTNRLKVGQLAQKGNRNSLGGPEGKTGLPKPSSGAGRVCKVFADSRGRKISPPWDKASGGVCSVPAASAGAVGKGTSHPRGTRKTPQRATVSEGSRLGGSSHYFCSGPPAPKCQGTHHPTEAVPVACGPPRDDNPHQVPNSLHP